MRETESVSDFRKAIFERFGVDSSSFLITIVGDNNIKKMVDINSKVEDIADIRGQGSILLYQINPELNPQIPPIESVSKTDSNNGVSEEWTRIIINNLHAQKQQYSSYITFKPNSIPRIMWIRKDWTMHQLHFEVFKFHVGVLFLLSNKDKVTRFRNANGDCIPEEEFE